MAKLLNVPALRRAGQVICLMAAGSVLAGCVVVPAYGPHYYRPAPYYYSR